VRFSLGPFTTTADVDRVLQLLPPLVAQARGEAAA
jgi:cysteine sulfinate desulfinase/cysteine desulfurase-like protein